MQIIENWTDIKGEIESSRPSETQQGFTDLEVKIAHATDVEAFPNLLKDTVGQTLTVQVPQSAAAQTAFAPGNQISCRVRRAGPNRIYAHPEHIHPSAK